MEKENVSVRFVIFGDEVLAVFMGKSSGRRYFKGKWLRGCYAHTGQHSECYDGMQRRKRASFEQFKDLKTEMERLGYIIKVV